MRKFLLISILCLAQIVLFAQTTKVSVVLPEEGKLYSISHYNTNYSLTFCWEKDSVQADSVKLLPFNYQENQYFYFHPQGDSTFTIQSVSSGYYLSRSDGSNTLMPDNTGWDMIWQSAQPGDLTLVQFKIEGLINDQFVQIKNMSRYGVSTTKCYLGIDYGESGTAYNGIVYDDKQTSYGIKSYWVIKEVNTGLDQTVLESTLTECGDVLDTLGTSAVGYNDFATFLDYVDQARIDVSTQAGINHLVDTLQTSLMKFKINNASNSYPVDVTEYYFGDLSSNWKTTVSGGNFGLTSNVTAGDYTGQYFEHWTPSTAAGKYLYKSAAVPTGSYSLKAACMISNGQYSYLYANSKELPVTTADATGAYFDLGRFAVTDGALEFGLRADSALAQWFAISQIQLLYYGYNSDDMVSAVEEEMVKADNMKSEYIQSSLVDVLSAAIAAGTTAVATPTQSGLLAAAAQLKSALDQAQASKDAYAALLVQLEASASTSIVDPSTEGAKIFLAAIDANQNIYDSQTGDVATIEEAIKALKKATRAYSLSSATPEAPVDVTGFLQNANMNAGNTGWTWIAANSKKTNTKTSEYTGFAGTYFLEEWVNSTTKTWAKLGNWDFYQTLTDIPSGTYTFSAVCIATNQGQTKPDSISGVQLYVNDVAIPVATGNGASTRFTITMYSSVDTLRVGFRGINPTCNWWAIDEATLSYSGGKDLTGEAERVNLKTLIESVTAQKESAATVKGDGAFQIPTSVFTALEAAIATASNKAAATVVSKAEMQDAEVELNAALATFKSQGINGPDYTRKYRLIHYMSSAAMDASYTGSDALILAEPGEGNDNQTFVFSPSFVNGRPYNMRSNAGKYIMLKGTDNWTMDARDTIGTASVDSAAYNISWVRDNLYAIQTMKGYLGTNSGAGAVGSPLYGDKSYSLEEVYWLIEDAGLASVRNIAANGKTTIAVSDGKIFINANEVQSVDLYTLSGRRIKRTQSNMPVDLTSLPAGVYLVKVGDGTVGKVLKK